ncbi:MAG TPA: type II secretion system protein [Vicinamibacterales bacterium]
MPRAGQVNRDAGYAMAALLVSISIAAVMMAAVMPVWKQMARREKEEELIFRGLQYARALRLFGMKYANASPPNLDVLVEQRFLRKKYKDPITNDDFQPVLAGQALPGTPVPGQPNAGRGQPNAGRGQSPNSSLTASPGANPSGPGQPGASPFAPTNSFGPSARPGAPSQPGTTGRGFSPIGTPGAGATGGVIGVVSKSKDQSIRLYNGRSHYNEWAFVSTPQVQAPGAGGPGGRGGRGGPGGNNPANPTSPFSTPGPFNGPGRGGPGRGTNPAGPGGRGFGPQPTSPNSPARPIQVPRPQ